jgi:hypothetical protein
VITIALHWSLFWARRIKSISSHSIYIIFVLILSSHLRLDLPNGLFLLGFPNVIFYAFIFSPMRAICPTHLVPLDVIVQIIIVKEYKLWIFPLCNLVFSQWYENYDLLACDTISSIQRHGRLNEPATTMFFHSENRGFSVLRNVGMYWLNYTRLRHRGQYLDLRLSQHCNITPNSKETANRACLS